MRGDDADIARGYLDQLHMPRRPPREGDALGRQATQPPGVVGRLVGRQQVRGLGKPVDAHAVLQHHDDVVSGQLDAPDGGEGTDFEGRLAFKVVPEDELRTEITVG